MLSKKHLLSLVSAIAGYTLCVNPTQAQTTYPALNFSLVSTINPETNLSTSGYKYSGCWGWTNPANGKEYAIAGAKDGTYWIDISNPATPSVSAYAAGTSTNATWREMKTYQNYCYVVADDNWATGLQIFDMASLPATVTLVSSNMNLLKRGHTCWVDGNKLYVSSVTYSNTNFSSMNVYSLATPTAPVLLRSLEQDYPAISLVHDAFIRRDTIFASCGFQGMFVLRYDQVQNKFILISSLNNYPSNGYNHSSALTPNGKTLVFMDEIPAGLPIKVANSTNLSNIQVLSTANQYSLTTPHNPFMYNNQYCFVSAYRDGTQLWDISNPNAPYLAGYFDSCPQSGGNNNTWTGSDYDGQWGLYPWFPSGHVFALDRLNGGFIIKPEVFNWPEIDVTSNAQPVYDGSILTSTLNNTAFGNVLLNGTAKTNTFVITNSGVSTLTITSLNLVGSTDFSMNGFSLPLSLPTNATASFVISYSPTQSGPAIATVQITNTDVNEGAYDFLIRGSGYALNAIGLEESSSDKKQVLLFPNPATNEVQLQLPWIGEEDFEILVTDASGKTVLVKQRKDIFAGNEKPFVLKTNALSTGNYNVQVRTQNTTNARAQLLIVK